jgi:hypothetical protein
VRDALILVGVALAVALIGYIVDLMHRWHQNRKIAKAMAKAIAAHKRAHEKKPPPGVKR